MKLKINSNESSYNVFVSFVDAFPNKDKTLFEFQQKKEHLYKIRKPKLSSNYFFIAIQSKERCKVEIKIWYTGTFKLIFSD